MPRDTNSHHPDDVARDRSRLNDDQRRRRARTLPLARSDALRW